MKRHGLSLFVAALLMTGALYLSVPLHATDYEGPPPTTPDYGAVWTGPIIASDPYRMEPLDNDLLYAANDNWYSVTMGRTDDNSGRPRMGIAISRFDRFGNCLIQDRMTYWYGIGEFYLYWYQDQQDELWLTGVSLHHRFHVMHVNENGDADVDGLFSPLPDVFVEHQCGGNVFEDSLGYPHVLLQKWIGEPGNYENIVTLYKFSHDFTEVLDEIEYPEVFVDNDRGAVMTKGPGDTLHVAFAYHVGEDPWNTPLFYTKIGFHGEIYQSPVCYMDNTQSILMMSNREQLGLVVDNHNHVYVICQYIYSSSDRRSVLHIYRNDGTFFERDLEVLSGNETVGGHTITLDCMGNAHFFWIMFDDDLQSIGHAAVANGDTEWVIAPHHLDVVEEWNTGFRYSAACSPSEYRIGLLNSTTVPQDWDNLLMWLLGRPEEPDPSHSHQLLNTNEPLFEESHPPVIYPNPFNSSTTIRFYTRHSGPVFLSIYDILGREVTILTNSTYTPGWHAIPFHCRSGTLSSGTYFLHINIPGASPIITRLVYTK